MLSKKIFFLFSTLLCLNASSTIHRFGNMPENACVVECSGAKSGLVFCKQKDHLKQDHETIYLIGRKTDAFDVRHPLCETCGTYNVEGSCGYRLKSQFNEDGTLKPDADQPNPPPATAPQGDQTKRPVKASQGNQPRRSSRKTPHTKRLARIMVIAATGIISAAMIKSFWGSRATTKIKTAQGVIVKITFDVKNDSFITFKQKIAAQLKIAADSFKLIITGEELTAKNFDNYRSTITKEESILEVASVEENSTSL